LGVKLFLFFFKIHFNNGKIIIIYKILAIDVGSFASFLQKWGRNNVPPNYRIKKCHQLLNIYSTMVHWLEAGNS
jgi:hypothetical protein